MLSPIFKERMESILGKECEQFIRAVEEENAVRGMRVNTVKITTENFLSSYTGAHERIPYCAEGIIPAEAEGFGNTPEHHSGMIYMQDPGAMAALCAIKDIPSDAWVLDTCAAPGGKSSQIAAKIPNGFLLSNEYVPKRAKTVVSNFERLGIKNAIVTSLDTSELPKLFCEAFDLVICDAPCSGEGMFRKSDEAIEDWSVDNVLACAQRQRQILKNLPSLVKPGGYLLYSTCTYSLEENEMTVDEFLSENPEFSLVETAEKLKTITADGICYSGAKCSELNKCRRFYPHISRGEGQFVSLMKKSENSSKKTSIFYKSAEKPLLNDELSIIRKFFADNLTSEPSGRLARVGDNLTLIAHGCPIPPKSVFMAGVLLGEINKGILHPSHQFFSVFGGLMKRKEELDGSDGRITKYLHGEEIDAVHVTDNGWCAVTYRGVPLGGGKVSAGKIKNHYPKGLRLK